MIYKEKIEFFNKMNIYGVFILLTILWIIKISVYELKK